MSKKVYGDAYKEFEILPGTVYQDRLGSKIACHDIFDELPAFMMEADMLYVDPPWNSNLFHSFYTKAGLPDVHAFEEFTDILFQRIAEIAPKAAYVEIGKQNFEEFIVRMVDIFPQIQSWEITYRKKNPAYLIRGGWDRTCFDFTGYDDVDTVRFALERETFECVADPCIGKGLTAIAAYALGKRFVGTELQTKKLALLIKNLTKKGDAFEAVPWP
jgi:hypothetical protein